MYYLLSWNVVEYDVGLKNHGFETHIRHLYLEMSSINQTFPDIFVESLTL